MTRYAELFADYIKLQEKQKRSSKRNGGLLLLAGMALIGYAAVRGINMLEAIKMGIGFVTSGVSVVPFRDVYQREEKIISFTHLKSKHEGFEQLPLEEQQELMRVTMDILRNKA